MARRTTVVDVAKRAKVGASTVSRYLRGVTVRPEVALRVSKAIDSLGYHPNETARALRGGRTRTIGVILPKVSNVFFSQSMQVIEDEARLGGYTVVLFTHKDSMAQQMEHLATVRRYRVDGVIIAATPGTTVEQIRTVTSDMPLVAFDSFLSGNVDSVLLRNREAGRLATEHLIRHGYKKIACVTAKDGIYSFQERIAGYTEAMEAQSLKPHLITAPDYEQLRYRLASIIRGKNRPAAILSLSDFATLTIFLTFKELGLAASESIPLIGFDDFGFAPLVDPPLTVIRQPIEKMVRYAMNALIRRIDGDRPEDGDVIMLPGELICRRSCGCE